MAVPNTTTFSFQDVCTEIYGSASASMNLADAFADAIGTFNPTYEGSRDQLLNFRGYVHVPKDIRCILHFMDVNADQTKLNWEVVLQNGTTSNAYVLVRIKNVSKASAWVTIVNTTSNAQTISDPLVGLTVDMGVTNEIGDDFAIEMDLDFAYTWTGTIYAEWSFILNYNWLM